MRRQAFGVRAGLCATALLVLGASRPTQDLSGKWTLRVSGSTGTAASSLSLSQVGAALTGDHVPPSGRVRPLRGQRRADSVYFSIPAPMNQPDSITYRGVVLHADSIAGSVHVGDRRLGTFTVVRNAGS